MNSRESEEIINYARDRYALSFDIGITEYWRAIRDQAWKEFDEALNEIKSAVWREGERDCAENMLRVMANKGHAIGIDLKSNPYDKENNA